VRGGDSVRCPAHRRSSRGDPACVEKLNDTNRFALPDFEIESTSQRGLDRAERLSH
jgi:hypothetical protein